MTTASWVGTLTHDRSPQRWSVAETGRMLGQAYMEAFERGYLLERACAMKSLEERLLPRRAATLATHLRKSQAAAGVRAVAARLGQRHVRRLFGGRNKLSKQLQQVLRDATTQVSYARTTCKSQLVHHCIAQQKARSCPWSTTLSGLGT
jgi:hypothetical protein